MHPTPLILRGIVGISYKINIGIFHTRSMYNKD